MLRTTLATVLALTFTTAAAVAEKETLPVRTLADGHHVTDGPRATPELIAAITAQDAALFDAVFGHCSADKIATMVTDDVEFYHDKTGQTSHTKKEFVDNTRGMCERVASGSDFRARRELVPGTLEVYPMNGYGALEIGTHRFYKLTPGKPDELTEVSKFAQLWKNENGTWKLARVISFDHRLGP